MAYADKQVLVRIPAYLPPEPYPKLPSPRHLQTSGSSSVKSGSSCCTSSDSASAPRQNVPRIVRTPSKCRSGVYTYEKNRSYSKMADPLRAKRNASAGGRKRKYVDTPCAYLSPSNAAWRTAASSSHQLPSVDLPANFYGTPQTTEFPLGCGLPDQPLGSNSFRKSAPNGQDANTPTGFQHPQGQFRDRAQQQTMEEPAQYSPFVFGANSVSHSYERHHNKHGRGGRRFRSTSAKNGQDPRVYASNPALNAIPHPGRWPKTPENIGDTAIFRDTGSISPEANGSGVYGQYNKVEYPLRRTASMFHLDGQSHGRSPSVFDAGFKANLLRARLEESKALDDLLRLAEGTYDGNEFEFDENTKGLGDDHDLEGFRDLKISAPQDEENGQLNGPQRSSSTSYTDDNSTSSPLKPLQIAVDETDTLDHLADDALAELNKALEPSQPIRPQMPPTDGRVNVAEQVIARLNGDCDLCDPRHLNRSPLCYSRENRHAPSPGGCRRGGCSPHSWNADILRTPPRACGQTFLMRNLERRPSPQSRLSEPIIVHGLVEREPNVRSRVSPGDDQMSASRTQNPNSYPRVHQPQTQQGWQANEKQFGCDEWGRNGIALMQTYTVLRPSPQAANNQSDCQENQTKEPPSNRYRKSSANESDASSIDLDDSYGLGE
ncbi:hypothetical protein AAHC03_04578 [Spirometra sp. Aus1]